MALPTIYIILIELSSPLVMASIAMVKHHNQKKLGKESLFHLTLPHHCPSLKEVKEGAQGRNLEAGTQVEAVEEWFLVACSLWLYQPALFVRSITTCPDVTAPKGSGLGPSTSIMYQEYTQASPQTDLMGTFAQLRFHPLRSLQLKISLVSVKLILKTNQDSH